MSQPTHTIGPFNRITVLHRASMVELCTGFDRSGRPVTIVALSPEAGADPHWCAEFADLVSKDGTALGPMDSTIHETDLYGTRPWAASYPEPGRRGAERLLAHLPGAIPEGTDPSSLLPSSGILDALNAAGRPPTDGPFAPPRAGYGPNPTQQEQYPSPYARPPAGTPTSGGAPGYGQPQPPQSTQPAPPSPYQRPAGYQAGPASAPPSYQQPAGYQQPSGYQQPAAQPQPAAYQQSPAYPSAYPAAARPPEKSGGRSGLVVAVLAGVLVVAFLAVLGGVGIYKAVSDPDEKPTAGPTRSSSPTPSPSTESTPSGTPSPSATAAPADQAEPTLKSVAAVSVVGPTWAASDATYTMTFRGWPFAFRTPKNFGCLKASNPPPGGSAWVCVAESAGPKGRIAVIYRPCPTTCTAAEQKKLDQDWLDAPVQYRAKDASTRFHEKTAAKYELTFSHYFGAGPGQPLKYQVAVFGSSTPAEKAYLQKTVNDIRSQTP